MAHQEIPRKSLQEKIKNEMENKFYKADDRGISKLTIIKEKTSLVKKMNKAERQRLSDFIFGNNDINPLEDFNNSKGIK